MFLEELFSSSHEDNRPVSARLLPRLYEAVAEHLPWQDSGKEPVYLSTAPPSTFTQATHQLASARAGGTTNAPERDSVRFLRDLRLVTDMQHPWDAELEDVPLFPEGSTGRNLHRYGRSVTVEEPTMAELSRRSGVLTAKELLLSSEKRRVDEERWRNERRDDERKRAEEREARKLQERMYGYADDARLSHALTDGRASVGAQQTAYRSRDFGHASSVRDEAELVYVGRAAARSSVGYSDAGAGRSCVRESGQRPHSISGDVSSLERELRYELRFGTRAQDEAGRKTRVDGTLAARRSLPSDWLTIVGAPGELPETSVLNAWINVGRQAADSSVRSSSSSAREGRERQTVDTGISKLYDNIFFNEERGGKGPSHGSWAGKIEVGKSPSKLDGHARTDGPEGGGRVGAVHAEARAGGGFGWDGIVTAGRHEHGVDDGGVGMTTKELVKEILGRNLLFDDEAE